MAHCGSFTTVTSNTAIACAPGLYICCGQVYLWGNANATVYVGGAGNTWAFNTNGTLTSPADLSTTGNIYGGWLHGDGSNITGLPASYGNANVATYLASGNLTSNVITTGNISSNYFIGNGSQLTGINTTSNTIFK